MKKVPVSVRERFREELVRLEGRKILAKVDRPTEWVGHVVIGLKKSGELHICIDSKYLNDALQREHHTLPVIFGSWNWKRILVG